MCEYVNKVTIPKTTEYVSIALVWIFSSNFFFPHFDGKKTSVKFLMRRIDHLIVDLFEVKIAKL